MVESTWYIVYTLLGLDVVQKAVAQLAGRKITPVAFSFGRVASSVAALVSAIGGGYLGSRLLLYFWPVADSSLMPRSEVQDAYVIGAESGHVRSATPSIIGRLLRVINGVVDDKMAGRESDHVPLNADITDVSPEGARSSGSKAENRRARKPLRVSIFEPVADAPQGVPHVDWLRVFCIAVILIQLVISILPGWRLVGLLRWLAETPWPVVWGSLPQRREEKWACPKNGGSTVTSPEAMAADMLSSYLDNKGS